MNETRQEDTYFVKHCVLFIALIEKFFFFLIDGWSSAGKNLSSQ